MNGYQVGEAPVIGREGLLRLVAVVERLRARQGDEESESSWTTQGAAAPEPDPPRPGRGGVGGAAGGEPAAGGAMAGGAGGPGSAGGGSCTVGDR